jgi:hypothetical protein
VVQRGRHVLDRPKDEDMCHIPGQRAIGSNRGVLRSIDFQAFILDLDDGMGRSLIPAKSKRIGRGIRACAYADALFIAL